MGTEIRNFTLTTPTFENQTLTSRDQVGMVNNCWSEGEYELGIEALNAFRTVDKRYPTPSHMRHLLALALYPPPTPSSSQKQTQKSRHRPRPSASNLSPRKPNIHQAATEIPSVEASHLALELLTVFASTTRPDLLVTGLGSYASRPGLDDDDGPGKKSPLVDEVMKISKVRDCWGLIREGVLVRRDQVQTRDNDSDSDPDNGGGDQACVVAPYAWGVLNWWVTLFESDQYLSKGPSKLLLAHIPPPSRVGAPQWDVQAPLSVVAYAYKSGGQKERDMGGRLLRLLINATSTFAIAPAILVRATTDQVQTLSGTAFRYLIQDILKNTRGPFPLSLYTRFSFCIAALYLARSGSGTTERGVFGTVSSGKRGPRARPRASLGGMGEQMESQGESQGTGESQMESQSMLGPTHSETKYPYPSPSLHAIQALLKSVPREPNEDKFGMHAMARWTILSAVMSEAGWAAIETWIPVNDLETWIVDTSESTKAGFGVDANAGASGVLWSSLREQCEMLSL